jgi:hypothetical protein
MRFDVEQMVKNKEALRRKLAALPIMEKLRILDELRERALAIRAAARAQHGALAREEPPDYRQIDK